MTSDKDVNTESEHVDEDDMDIETMRRIVQERKTTNLTPWVIDSPWAPRIPLENRKWFCPPSFTNTNSS